MVRQCDFFVPRFFLVDLASSLVSPYSVDLEYHLLVDEESRIFVNKPTFKTTEGDSDYRDASRQGY